MTARPISPVLLAVGSISVRGPHLAYLLLRRSCSRMRKLVLALLLPAVASAQRQPATLSPVPIMIFTSEIARADPSGPILVDRSGNVVVSRWFQDSSISVFTTTGATMPVGRKGLGPGETIGGWTGGWVGDSLWLYSGTTLSVFTANRQLARKRTNAGNLFYLNEGVRVETIGYTALSAVYRDGSFLLRALPAGSPVAGSRDPSQSVSGALVRV